MMGKDLSRCNNSPTTSGFEDGYNSLDLSPRTIAQLRSEFQRKNSSKPTLAGIMVEVIDEVTGREVVFPSALGPQKIQKNDCPSIIRPKHMEAIRVAYDILDNVEIQAPEGDEMVDWVVDG